MITADTITDEQIRELRERVKDWLDEHPAYALGTSSHHDEWRTNEGTNLMCNVALGITRPAGFAGRRNARTRCAEILNARGAK